MWLLTQKDVYIFYLQFKNAFNEFTTIGIEKYYSGSDTS